MAKQRYNLVEELNVPLDSIYIADCVHPPSVRALAGDELLIKAKRLTGPIREALWNSIGTKNRDMNLILDDYP